MSKAFEEACIALQVYAGDEKGREIIATRIIDLARSGLIDPVAMPMLKSGQVRHHAWITTLSVVASLQPCAHAGVFADGAHGNT